MTHRAKPVVVGLWLLALALLIGLVIRADYSADMSVFLPRSPTPEQALLVDQLLEGTVSRLILVGIAGGSESGRSMVSRTMATTLRGQSEFASVLNGEDERLEADRQWLFDHRYVLSPAVHAERFSVPGLHAALQNTLDWLASSAGMVIEPLVPRDPTSELIQILEPLEDEVHPRRKGGVWVSRDGQEALMLALTRASGADLDAQTDAMARIRAGFETAVKALTDTGEPRLEMTGPGVFAVESRATIKGEVTRIALLASLLIVVLLLLIFRSPTLLLLGLLPVVTGALTGIAAVSLGFGVVHGLTIGFGATLIGEAVDYAIYLFVQRGTNPDADESATPAMAAFWPTIRLGLITSVCGFGVMLGSGFPGLAQLGLYSTNGLIAAALVTRLVLPVLLPPGISRRDFSPLGERLAVVAHRLARLRWLIPVLCMVAIVVIWQHREHLWNDSLMALSPISPAAQALDARLRGELGAPDTSSLIVIDAPDREVALQQAETLAAPLDTLVEAGAISGWDSPARYLPSAATQRTRLASLPDRETLAERLQVATASLPLKAGRLDPFLADVEAARASGPVTAESLAGTSFALAVEALLRPTPTGWRLLMPLRADSGGAPLDPERLRRAFASVPATDGVSVRFLDIKRESDALYAQYLAEAIELSLFGLVAILAVLWVALRSARQVWRVMLPLVSAVLVVMAGLVLAGESLILLHLVGLLLVVAVGSNYAIFFVGTGGDAAGPSPRTLASLLFANLTTLAGFGLLATSTVPVLRAIGVTVGPGAVLALLFAAMLNVRAHGLPSRKHGNRGKPRSTGPASAPPDERKPIPSAQSERRSNWT